MNSTRPMDAYSDSSLWVSLKNKKLVLFLDYDGTLTPIVKRPHMARLSNSMKSLIQSLALKQNINVCIVSGRCLKDVRSKVALGRVCYAGNHGFELKGPGMRFAHPKNSIIKTTMTDIAHSLNIRLGNLPGVFIENKTYTLSVHYRLASAVDARKCAGIVADVVRPWINRKKAKLSRGKKVYEFRPFEIWHKGSIIRWYYQQMTGEHKDYLAIFIGDDKTDEDGFHAVNQVKGISIKVSELRAVGTKAKYWLKDTKSVQRFLKEILRIT